MSLASIRLCRELYDLSGWDDTYNVHDVSNYQIKGESGDIGEDWCPAYDLGYLLRKLPDEAGTQQPHVEKGVFVQRQSTTTNHMQYRAAYRYSKIKSQYADTPEDAACKLAIELFKQGILKKESV